LGSGESTADPHESPLHHKRESAQPGWSVTRQTISALEPGRYAPSLLLALRIAELFDTTVEDVYQINGKRRRG
jgi:hypothetical protein